MKKIILKVSFFSSKFLAENRYELASCSSVKKYDELANACLVLMSKIIMYSILAQPKVVFNSCDSHETTWIGQPSWASTSESGTLSIMVIIFSPYVKVSRDHDITKAVSWTLITQNHVCDRINHLFLRLLSRLWGNAAFWLCVGT